MLWVIKVPHFIYLLGRWVRCLTLLPHMLQYTLQSVTIHLAWPNNVLRYLFSMQIWKKMAPNNVNAGVEILSVHHP